MRTPHGLIIGKFYPPHRGHDLMIRTAAACSERVTVLVLEHPDESLPLASRVAWLREIHPDPAVTVIGAVDAHPIDYGDPAVWDLHVSLFASAVAEVTPAPVTAVFSSEPYGAELAHRFGGVPVVVDVDRGLAPMSSTAFRADPVRHWEDVAEPVRAGLAARVVVVGAESTGTTTTALALRDTLRARGGSHGLTRHVPEHGRELTIEKMAVARARAALAGRPAPTVHDLTWPSEEFVDIARRQNALEDDAAARGGPVLICDTDAFATGIWHERYVGTRSAAVEVQARPHPLYLLSHHAGVPFADDGLRDGEHLREWMTDRFLDALSATGRRHVVLTGSLADRVATGLAAIDDLLTQQWHFTPPITPPNGT